MVLKNFVTKNFNIFFFNIFCFLFLIVGLQNHSQREKINLIFFETVSLPVPFHMGTSFILGSTIGGLIFGTQDLFKKK